ncbi:SDR family NAD(P)-dependent oxidoreductase [Sandaracinus amylolyticus]|uniref:SDR family NAD(P)-dependent oxidoreductase n=1 Tax=Sandaracinus amylolyticus TaxID=927083 RepID=UPI001F439CC3|nr:SDR family NAD(P)-dependent oxidoreductase [Sandaracinus amylolyticus]UJR80740.1 NADP-dependent 3-hydroxy acid dehydrogenase YdfG [Sandaracinus amylolyticus]
MLELEGLHVIVTGGAGALGTAVTRRLIELGARVHVPAFDEAEAKRFPLASDPRVSVRVGFDLSDEVQVERFYAHAPSIWASIQLAGAYAGGGIVETTPATLRRLLSTNAISSYLCCREAVKRMREQDGRGGRLVNVAAKPVLAPSANVSAYAAAKGAVTALTQSLAEELRPEGIWVNAVVPSTMDTPANRAAMPSADFTTWPSVEDVAETIVFLASPRNRTTSGALIPVYGRS